MQGRRGARLAVLAVAMSAVPVLLWAAPAAAHAAVVSSSPAQGQHLARAPHVVTIGFDQPVQPDAGGLAVLDSRGDAVQVSSAHPTPATLQATLPSDLGAGAYVANYTVTSVDGHVVSGGIVFLVGNVKAGSVSVVVRPKTTLTTWIDDGGQFLIYLGVLVASGVAFFFAFVLGAGRDDEPQRLRRRAWASAVVALVGMAVTGASQAVLTGGGVASVTNWGLERQAFSGKFGQQCAAQLVGLALCLLAFRLRTTMHRQFAAFYGLLVAAGAFVLFGHAWVSPERWLSIPADVAHVVFAALWAGGVVALVFVLRGRTRALFRNTTTSRAAVAAPAAASGGTATGWSSGAEAATTTATLVLDRPTTSTERGAPTGGVGDGGSGPGDLEPDSALLADTTRLVGRFSSMAALTFAGIIVAGTLLAIAEVGSVANLFETGYGQLLLLKLGLVGLLLLLAGYNRFLLLPGLFSTAGQGDPQLVRLGWRRLLGTVRLEALGMVAVLGVTALLANGTPSNGASLPPPQVFSQSQPFQGGHVSLHITPNQALVNDWTVQFTNADGAPVDVAESVSAYLVLPAQNVGPIETDLKRVGVGRFALVGSPNPPIVGTWQIVLQIQVSAFSQPEVSFVDHVQ
jgi:copper transport protein